MPKWPKIEAFTQHYSSRVAKKEQGPPTGRITSLWQEPLNLRTGKEPRRSDIEDDFDFPNAQTDKRPFGNSLIAQASFGWWPKGRVCREGARSRLRKTERLRTA